MNDRSRPMTVALEPLGYLLEVPPGQSRGAEFAADGPDRSHLEITVDENGVAVWEESGGGEGLSPEGGHYGADPSA